MIVRPFVLAMTALALAAASGQPPLSVGLIQPHEEKPLRHTSLTLAIRTAYPRHFKLIHGEDWLAVGLLHPGVNRIRLPLETFTGGKRFHLVLVTKNGPTVLARDLLLTIHLKEISGGDGNRQTTGDEHSDISSHFRQRLASSFHMDDLEKRRRKMMGDGSYGPMDPATGRYDWLDSVNILGVVSAIAKALKEGKSKGGEGGDPSLLRRVTIPFSRVSSNGSERTVSARVSLEVTPPSPYPH